MTDRTGQRILAGIALALMASAVGGCATSIADLPLVGTPAGAPARSTEARDYLPVHDVPTTRDDTAMSPAEQAKLQAELAAARDRQAVVLPPDPAKK
jgi:hypothetical protein